MADVLTHSDYFTAQKVYRVLICWLQYKHDYFCQHSFILYQTLFWLVVKCKIKGTNNKAVEKQ